MLSEERKRNLETGNRVREIRNGMDYTQTAMANELDVSLSAYKKIESGTMAITINMLKTLNEKFGVSADYILFGKEEHIEDIDEFSKCHFTHVCSGPTHQFLEPIRWSRMDFHSTNRLEGTQIQTHCGEETNILGRGIWLEQGFWVARQESNAYFRKQ